MLPPDHWQAQRKESVVQLRTPWFNRTFASYGLFPKGWTATRWGGRGACVWESVRGTGNCAAVGNGNRAIGNERGSDSPAVSDIVPLTQRTIAVWLLIAEDGLPNRAEEARSVDLHGTQVVACDTDGRAICRTVRVDFRAFLVLAGTLVTVCSSEMCRDGSMTFVPKHFRNRQLAACRGLMQMHRVQTPVLLGRFCCWE